MLQYQSESFSQGYQISALEIGPNIHIFIPGDIGQGFAFHFLFKLISQKEKLTWIEGQI